MPTNFVEVAQKLLCEANAIWSEMGLCEAERLTRVDRFAVAIKTSLERLLDEERTARDKMRVAVREALEKIAEISGILGDVDSTLPPDVATAPLVEQERTLTGRLHLLQAERDERLEHLSRYRTEAFTLSSDMGEQFAGPVAVVDGELLTKDAVRRAETARDELRRERQRREQTIGQSLGEATRICDELEDDAAAARMPQRPVAPTRANIERAAAALAELQRARAARAEAAAALRRTVAALRDQLGAEAGEGPAESEGLGARAVRQLEAEAGRLAALRRERAAKLAATRRAKVEALWEELALPRAERVLPGEREDVDGERLLELYDAEVERLEALAAEVRPIVAAIANRERILVERAAFETETRDETRLFQRDPGRLLREERQRKVFEKDLPRLERSLKERLRAWEEQHAAPFVYREEPYLLRIERDEAEERVRREAERLRKERDKAERRAAAAPSATAAGSGPGLKTPAGAGGKMRTVRGKTPQLSTGAAVGAASLKRPLSPISMNSTIRSSDGDLPLKMQKLC